jgi:hypothetical protein
MREQKKEMTREKMTAVTRVDNTDMLLNKVDSERMQSE